MLKDHEVRYVLSKGVNTYHCGMARITLKDGFVTVWFKEEPALTSMLDCAQPFSWWWDSNCL